MPLKNSIILVSLCFLLVLSCNDKKVERTEVEPLETYIEPEPIKEFGFVLDDYVVKRDTVKSGESFGEILERNNLGYPKIFQISEVAKDTFDIARHLRAGKPYTMLFSKDSLQTPQSFIYQPSLEDYVVINFKDSITAYKSRKPVTIVQKEFSGVIESGSNITQIMSENGVSQVLAYKLADEIYAWTIDMGRLYPGDRFKVIYEDKYIDDSIYVGIHDVKAAMFEHKGDSLYAFQYETDTEHHIMDYLDENAKNLRRAFLKSPIALRYRISSRYNLNRRIAYYGYKVRPHKGTDFAASIGTPILATANGTVEESTRRGGNGKYVKIRHNATYSTQYLHMKAQKVKKGDYVKQGDVIGWIGMTGNTGGPHVCYRFWKNGRQVDPFKEKLPEAKSLPDSLKADYHLAIRDIRAQLNLIEFKQPEPKEETLEEDLVSQLQ